MNTQIVPVGADRSNNFFSPLNVFGSPSSSLNNPQIAEEEGEMEGKVKTRILSIWNNVKFGMKIKCNFSKETPVFVLGKCYHKRSENSQHAEVATDATAFTSHGNIASSTSVQDDEGFEGFKSDYITKIWFSYRREFPSLGSSSYNTDCGWGCMLRSGQMLLGQGLVNHFLGRTWRWTPDVSPSTRDSFKKDVTHRKIIKWFSDKPSRNSPLSIHSLVEISERSGKKAGDWYGPGAVAHILKQAVNSAANDNFEFDAIRVCVAQDCAVYIKDVLEECCDNEGVWRSLILLIPVRLGTEKFNPLYASCITELFTMDQCIGVIGGRPKHSLYFIGYQDDKLIHIDPHYCQDFVDVWAPNFNLNSFHCRTPRKLAISKMDPSCCIGFYCKTKNDFYNLIDTIQTSVNAMTQSGQTTEYPMFVFVDGYSKDVEEVKKQPPRRPANVLDSDHSAGDSTMSADTSEEIAEYEVV